VAEGREELTTEGGLDVIANHEAVQTAIERLTAAGVRVSLFIDPDPDQVRVAQQVGSYAIELHTGRYADANTSESRGLELSRIRSALKAARSLGLVVNAGHGLTLDNVHSIAALPGVNELNIGHSVVARALFVGIERACREMKERIQAAARQRVSA